MSEIKIIEAEATVFDPADPSHALLQFVMDEVIQTLSKAEADPRFSGLPVNEVAGSFIQGVLIGLIACAWSRCDVAERGNMLDFISTAVAPCALSALSVVDRVQEAIALTPEDIKRGTTQ